MEKEQLMENTIAETKKRVFGRVKFNEGWYAEIQTFGIEGVEKNILLDTIVSVKRSASSQARE
jgi:hypothetical protein